MQKEDIKQNLKRGSTWIRILFMVLFAIIYTVAISIFWLIVVFQAIYGLITGGPNERVLHFSKGLTSFLYQVLNYLTYQIETKPFPFDDWPSSQ